MYCGKCGTDNALDLSYCVSCGAHLESQRTPSGATPRPTPAPGGTIGGRATELPLPVTGAFEEGAAIGPDGRYAIREELGRGGMGVVYRATDSLTGEDVALKVMLPSLLESASAKKRFLSEATLARKLQHRNIVNVYGGDTHGEVQLLVMECLDGRTLRAELKSLKADGELMPVERAIEIFRQCRAALEHAHGAGVLHRDVKPENVMLQEDAHGGVQVKLLDFGIARALDPDQWSSTNLAQGTAGYVAPEVLQGGEPSERSDLYSLGVVLYECLTGLLPAGRFPAASEVRGAEAKLLDDLVDSLLSAAPEQRPSSASAVRQSLPDPTAEGGEEAAASQPQRGMGRLPGPPRTQETRVLEDPPDAPRGPAASAAEQRSSRPRPFSRAALVVVAVVACLGTVLVWSWLTAGAGGSEDGRAAGPESGGRRASSPSRVAGSQRAAEPAEPRPSAPATPEPSATDAGLELTVEDLGVGFSPVSVRDGHGHVLQFETYCFSTTITHELVRLDGEEAMLFGCEANCGTVAACRLFGVASPKDGRLALLELVRPMALATPFWSVNEPASKSIDSSIAQRAADDDWPGADRLLESERKSEGLRLREEIPEDDPSLAWVRWYEANDGVSNGAMTMRTYRGTGPLWTGDSTAALQVGDRRFVAYFKGGVAAYDERRRERQVVFAPHLPLNWPTALAPAGEWLIVGTRGEGIALVNLRDWTLVRVPPETVPADVASLRVDGCQVRINESSSFTVPRCTETGPSRESARPAAPQASAGGPDSRVREGTHGLTNPRLLVAPEPVYPEAARRVGYGGSVILRAIIGTDGRVQQAEVLKGLGRFGMDEAALNAVKQRVYAPGSLDGRPVEVISTIRIAFTLD